MGSIAFFGVESGHWGTGELGISMRSRDDLEKAKPLVERSYEDN